MNTIQELYNIVEDLPLSTVITLRNIQWTGRVEYINEERILKKVVKEIVKGKRRAGKPWKQD